MSNPATPQRDDRILPKIGQPDSSPLSSARSLSATPDVLQIQAATNLGIAQANEARHRQLASQEQVLQWIHKEIDARSINLQHREDQLTLRQQEVAEQKQAADKSFEEAKSYKDAALAERAKIDELSSKAERDLAEARKLQTEAKASQVDADKKLRQADASFAWPQALEGENWTEWRLKLMAQVESDWRSALVLSRLQVLSSLLRSTDNENPVLEALAALGSAICALDTQKAKDLATALTQGSQGAFELSVPPINENVDKIWMKAPPTTTKVSRVIGWCVKDKQRVVQFPAQVE